ncbi:MAG: hypothetical protein M3Q94_21720 [Pseudomonadota bacterium]|nr:hypothetical protein [Pseudomonadota bacterium]
MAYINNKDTDSEATLLLCHGGEHQLSIVSQTDNPWVNQRLALQHMSVPRPFFADFSPQIGDGQILENGVAKWTVTLPPDGLDTEAELRLVSEFTAQPYTLNFSTGHYRLKFHEILQPSQPIVLKEDIAVLSAKVTSHYIEEKHMEGVEVEWFVDGNEYKILTDAGGRCEFVFVPERAGKPDIHIKLWSPFDNDYIVHNFNIEVLATSQWASDLEFMWNGVPYPINVGITARESGAYQKIRINPKNSNLIGSSFHTDPHRLPIDDVSNLTKPKLLSDAGIEWFVRVNDAYTVSSLTWRCTPSGISRNIPIRFFGHNLNSPNAGHFTLDGKAITQYVVELDKVTTHKLKFTPTPDNSLIGLDIHLNFSSAHDGMETSPQLEVKRTLTNEGAEWIIDARNFKATMVWIDIIFSDPLVRMHESFRCDIMP